MANSAWTNGESSDSSGWLNSSLRSEFSGASVLLVEDDDGIRELLKTMLELAGLSPTVCSSAEAALEQLREQPFDLVLTDYMLPHRTGAWLLEQASTEGLIDATPVLVVTAHPQPPDVGEYDIIAKPFDLDHLISRVRQHLEGPTRRRKMPYTAPLSGEGKGDGTNGRKRTPVELILYVRSQSARSAQAIRTVERMIARFSSDRVTLTVHDLSVDPRKGIEDSVAYTPTLVRRSPGPRTFILGHIENPELVAELLEVCGEEAV